MGNDKDVISLKCVVYFQYMRMNYTYSRALHYLIQMANILDSVKALFYYLSKWLMPNNMKIDNFNLLVLEYIDAALDVDFDILFTQNFTETHLK